MSTAVILATVFIERLLSGLQVRISIIMGKTWKISCVSHHYI